MTRDELKTVLKGARETVKRELGEALDAAIAEEREACARIADAVARDAEFNGFIAQRVEAAIRARGK